MVYTIELFDIEGKLVDTIKNSMIKAGNHEITYNTSKLSSGMYFLMLTNGKDFKAKKIAVVK